MESSGNQGKDYNWIILFFLVGSAIVRFIMQLFAFEYIDYFIATISLIGLDYTTTNIFNRINRKIANKIDNNSNLVQQVKEHKKERHKRILGISILIIMGYNILHFIFFSCSTGNDMLSMIVLGISLTDESITNFFAKCIHI